jgi:intracellular septation protein
MNLFFDFLPIILFFIAYKWFGIYVATAVLMLATTVHVGVLWALKNKVEKMHLITLACVLIFGSATLIAHDPVFIKWKPTIIYWLLGIAFLFSALCGKRTLTEKLIDSKIQLPQKNWQTINHFFSGFFIIMGALNLFVAYEYTTAVWVQYKLFGTLALTLCFMLMISGLMLKYSKDTPQIPEPLTKNPNG